MEMNIKLSPQVRLESLVVEKAGDTLIFNGASYDFLVLADGDTLPADGHDCEWIEGDISRVNGKLDLTIIRPYAGGNDPIDCFPEPLINPVDGVIINANEAAQ
jgi:hypothetical protein